MTMDPLTFLESIAGHTQARYPARTPRLGTVDPAYTSGDPKITFDGESSLSGKTYPYAGYTPQAGDRVVLLPVGNTFLIVGAVGVLDGRGKAASVHTHVESDITSLVTDLASKTNKSTLTTKGDLYVATAASTPARVAVGSNNQLLIADSTQTTGVRWDTTLASLSVTGSITTDASWNSFTFSNSWTDNTTARYRMMPDGTVQFKGIITKATNPTNGEIVITGLAAAYRPLARANFLCACSGRTGNGTQKIEVETDGTCKIWDMAAASGDVCLDPIRYPVI